MNKWIFIASAIIVIFIFGKFVYDAYGDDLRQKLGFVKVSQPTLNANISTPTSNNTGISDKGLRSVTY